MSEDRGTMCELFALMKGDRLVMIVAKDPNKPVVYDITEELAQRLHHARSSPLNDEQKSDDWSSAFIKAAEDKR